jgi:thiamine biosynthesis protein ThiS
MQKFIQIKVDGGAMEVAEDLTLAGLLDLYEESDHPDRVVEVNNRYVDRRDYGWIILRAGDRVEVLRVSFWGLKP